MPDLAKSATAVLTADFCESNVFLTIGNVVDEKREIFLSISKQPSLIFGDQNEGMTQNNIRIGILMDKLLLKEVPHKFWGGLVQKWDFFPISAQFLVNPMAAIFNFVGQNEVITQKTMSELESLWPNYS